MVTSAGACPFNRMDAALVLAAACRCLQQCVRASVCCSGRRVPEPQRAGHGACRFEGQAQALASWVAEALVLAYEDGKRPLCAEAHTTLLTAQKVGTVPDKVQVATRASPEDFERDVLVPPQPWWACSTAVPGLLAWVTWHARGPGPHGVLLRSMGPAPCIAAQCPCTMGCFWGWLP